MRIDICNARDLGRDELEAWKSIVTTKPHLDSPFFRPELVLATARARDDVQVAVVRSAGEPALFFPFQGATDGCAQAITGRLSEFHGFIARKKFSFDPQAIIRACRLRAWHFDHVPDSQIRLERFAWRRTESPYLDLSQGYDAYIAAQKGAGSSCVKQAERKMRKLAREVGPLRFEWHTDDQQVWDALVRWKSDQHRRTRVLEIFKYSWVHQMLGEIRREQGKEFSAPVSALYAGDQLAAVHFGLASRRALHIWFPAYNRQLQAYSPGVTLLLEMARHAASQGMQRIDLGKGEERYKADFASGAIPLLEGSIDFRLAMPLVRASWSKLNAYVKESPWRSQLEMPILATRQFRQWLAFR